MARERNRLQIHGPGQTALVAAGPFHDLLVDEMLECYLEWRRESSAARTAYDRWSIAPRGEAELYFGTYAAALDREEAAARHYAHAVQELTRWLPHATSGGRGAHL